MQQRVLLAAGVFAASFLILAWNAGRPGLATAYVDPVGKIQAQDESLYAVSSLTMARHASKFDHWMTPRFLGRYVLYKPPLIYWLSAAGVKLFGETSFAIRSPSILAGAGTVALVFWWVLAFTSWEAALTAAILLLSSHLFFVLSRVGMTDALLTFEITLAMYALARDPRLESRAALWVFGGATGAAIMTKAIAGSLPLFMLGLFCLISNKRPRLKKIAQAAVIAAVIALPWHIYQLVEHTRWFWAEYVLSEHVTWAFHTPSQTTNESFYYLRRLIVLDPVLLIAALLALLRVRPRMIIAWLAIVLASVIVWRYRNTSYLMPMIPAMAILVASAIPPQRVRLALFVAAGFAAGKMLMPYQPWGIPFTAQSVIRAEAWLDCYASQPHKRELMLIRPRDQFYSATLDLPRVRYVYIGARPTDPSKVRLPLDFEYLGIAVTASDFAKINELRPVFAQRLREWGLDTDAPIATTILARDENEVAALIASHPEADFYREK